MVPILLARMAGWGAQAACNNIQENYNTKRIKEGMRLEVKWWDCESKELTNRRSFDGRPNYIRRVAQGEITCYCGSKFYLWLGKGMCLKCGLKWNFDGETLEVDIWG